MTATKSKYWAIVQLDMVIFEGTFNECWNELVNRYAKNSLGELATARIKITRIK